MNSTWNTWLKAVFDVIVNSEVCFDQISKIINDFILVFIHKSLQLWSIFKLIKVFFKLSIEVQENIVVLV